MMFAVVVLRYLAADGVGANDEEFSVGLEEIGNDCRPEAENIERISWPAFRPD